MTKRQSSRRSHSLISGGSQRGFTLVELLVVLTVFVLLVTLTVPSYLATRPQRMLSGETNRVAAVMRQARLFSLRDNEKVYLEFLPEIDMYRLWNEQGWRAYADPIDAPGELPGRNPEVGDYDGDLDGDYDTYWDDGTPEDPDVVNDPQLGWVYRDTDGVYLDPDVLLMPTYPGNQPIRTLSPKLRITIDSGTGALTNITRDFSDTQGVGGDNIVPYEVDIRMREFLWDPAIPIGPRNGVLSHFPLYFMVFFPDGTVGSSWTLAESTGFNNEIIDLEPGLLGVNQVHLQVRGEDYNMESFNLFNPTVVVEGDEGPQEPLSPFDTLSLEDSYDEGLGRVLTINNLTGRVVIQNFRPYDLDIFHDYSPPVEYF